MPATRRVGAVFLALALALLASLPSAGAQTLLSLGVTQVNSDDFPNIASTVTLVDASGRPVLGLGPENWEVLEDGKPVKDVKVGSTVNSQVPLNVALAIDVSGSMQGRAIVDARAAASTFVQGLGPADKAAIISFAEKAQLVQGFTEKKEDLTRAIAGLGANGDTALYDAISLAAQEVGKVKGRRILIVLSDGEDTISATKQLDALGAMQAVEVPVFTVGLGDKVDRATLDGLAAGTGGVALYAPTSEGLTVAYRNIADQLRNQYVITHTSTLRADNQRHAVVVRAKLGNAVAEARSTFVAVSSPPEITVVAPQEGATVRGKVNIEVTAKARGKVARVEAIAAGQVIGVREQQPFTLEWDTSNLAAGNHAVDISVTDSYGNRAVKQVKVTVQALPKATLVPPTPTPTPNRPVVTSETDLTAPLLMAGALVGIGLVVTRSRRLRRQHRVPMRKVVPDKTCPTCGKRLQQGKPCPDCTAADDRLVRGRLRELAGLPPEEEEQQP